MLMLNNKYLEISGHYKYTKLKVSTAQGRYKFVLIDLIKFSVEGKMCASVDFHLFQIFSAIV